MIHSDENCELASRSYRHFLKIPGASKSIEFAGSQKVISALDRYLN